MTCSRRDFLRNTVGGSLASVMPLSAFTLLSHAEAEAALADSKVRWAFLVDTNKCVGCGLCVTACKTENEIPFDAAVTRTWVERYVVTKDGETHIDSPMGGRDGFIDDKIRDEEIDPKTIDKAFFVPKLCNHCETPPWRSDEDCAQRTSLNTPPDRAGPTARGVSWNRPLQSQDAQGFVI